MPVFLLHKFSKRQQYAVSVITVFFVAGICYLLPAAVGYKIVAFILMITVSLLAMFFDIFPVLLSACLSAAVWNFFFIPPRFTFSIRQPDDLVLFSMYFVIAMVNAVLTYKIREAEKRANRRIEKENTLQLYNTLLNSLSHELRTPIATIIGACDTLQNESSKLSDNNRHLLTTEIAKASLRLNRQVENLLNMSRLESGFLKPKNDWCDVNELIYEIIAQLQDAFAEKRVQIAIQDGLPLFKLDRGLMEQVLHNLLYNAALYTPGQAVITIAAMVNHTNHLVIKVSDTGKGFPQEEIPYVFEKFYRLKNSAVGGTGLGLSITKGFVEAMGGTIRLANEIEGAAFTIEIPAELAHVSDIENE